MGITAAVGAARHAGVSTVQAPAAENLLRAMS